MSEPRSIDPTGIRPGDRVRAERTVKDGHIVAHEFTVTHVVMIGDELDDLYIRYSPADAFRADQWTWTLLDRPEPPREPGTHWRDPETDAEYVLDEYGDYLRYRRGYSQVNSAIVQAATTIARLVPIPSRADLAEAVAVAVSDLNFAGATPDVPVKDVAKARRVFDAALEAWRAAQ